MEVQTQHNLTESQRIIADGFTKSGKFYFWMLSQLPMGWIAGLRVREIDAEKCITSVPFKWLTKNPFRSTYFAVQAMAAELSTATPCIIAIRDQKPSIAFIVRGMKSTFVKRATDRVFFECKEVSKAFEAVARCAESPESESTQITLKTVGKMKDDTIVSEFEIMWSFKRRRT